MADGKNHQLAHNKFWIPSIILALIAGFVIFRDSFFQVFLFDVFFLIFYWLGENVVSPDLDLISISGQDGRMITFGMDVTKKLRSGFFSKLIGFFIGIPTLLFSNWSSFYSYTMQFLGGHRNFWSHSLFVSTLGRMIWFNTIIAFILWFLFLHGRQYWNWSNDISFNLYLDIWLEPFSMAQFLAWVISDSIHIAMDTEYAKGRWYKVNKK